MINIKKSILKDNQGVIYYFEPKELKHEISNRILFNSQKNILKEEYYGLDRHINLLKKDIEELSKIVDGLMNQIEMTQDKEIKKSIIIVLQRENDKLVELQDKMEKYKCIELKIKEEMKNIKMKLKKETK